MKPQLNRNGIPVIQSQRRIKPDCINHHTGQVKNRFASPFLAERFIAEKIRPHEREQFRVYSCGDHFHLTTKAITYNENP